MNQDSSITQPEQKPKTTAAKGPGGANGATSNGTNGHHSNGTNGVNGHSNGNGTGHGAQLTSQGCIDMEHEYSAHNYHPLPVVFSRAKGAKVWDVEGKEYIDCLSAYCAMNQVGGLCRAGCAAGSSAPLPSARTNRSHTPPGTR